jgi:alpha-N-acetylglucosamine transferase
VAKDSLQRMVKDNEGLTIQLQKNQEYTKTLEERIKSTDQELKKKTELFVIDYNKSRIQMDELKRLNEDKDKKINELTQLLNEEKKSNLAKIQNL